MSFLFHRKTKKAMQYIWMALSVIIILSMVITYTGLSRISSTQTQQDTQTQDTEQATAPSSAPTTASSTAQPVQKLPFRVTPN